MPVSVVCQSVCMVLYMCMFDTVQRHHCSTHQRIHGACSGCLSRWQRFPQRRLVHSVAPLSSNSQGHTTEGKTRSAHGPRHPDGSGHGPRDTVVTFSQDDAKANRHEFLFGLVASYRLQSDQSSHAHHEGGGSSSAGVMPTKVMSQDE